MKTLFLQGFLIKKLTQGGYCLTNKNIHLPAFVLQIRTPKYKDLHRHAGQMQDKFNL